MFNGLVSQLVMVAMVTVLAMHPTCNVFSETSCVVHYRYEGKVPNEGLGV